LISSITVSAGGVAAGAADAGGGDGAGVATCGASAQPARAAAARARHRALRDGNKAMNGYIAVILPFTTVMAEPRRPVHNPVMRIFIAAAVNTALMLPLCVPAQVTSGKPASAPAEAIAACERAARQSLSSRGAPANDVSFTGTPSEQASAASDDLLLLRGTGSWRDARGVRKFAYSCNVDLRTPSAVGLVLRDTQPPAAEAETARSTLEPDLSHLSPAACESSAAAALKKRWPQVSEISFDSNTRRLSQESPSKADLRGQGRALPMAGAPYVLFGFDCEIDPRDGRVLSTRVSG
jgi:hypothetical protein